MVFFRDNDEVFIHHHTQFEGQFNNLICERVFEIHIQLDQMPIWQSTLANDMAKDSAQWHVPRIIWNHDERSW